MKSKQVIVIVVASVVALMMGAISVLGSLVGGILFGGTESISFFDSFASVDVQTGGMIPNQDFIGVINVVGEIGPAATDMWGTASGYNHDQSMEYIDQMMTAENNKGIMLYIDSPGGTVYESDELYLKLMEYKEETGRPIWAYFASQACSGGYYVAMAADKIYANRNGWTGSIGVIISLVNCEGLYEKLGIEEINITSGENKAMGSAGSELTEEQREILQSLVDEAYDQFVGIVSKGRKMDEKQVRELADGRIYSALQAKENNLIDEVSRYDECKEAFLEAEEWSESVMFHAPVTENNSVLSLFYGMLSELKPKTDSEVATEILESNRNGVLMYYAE